MSMVYKCDRCGKYYDNPNEGGGMGPFVWDGTMSKDQENADLCIDCYNDLVQWWTEKRKYIRKPEAECSKEKSDAYVIQEVYNRMAGRGATKEELDTFRNLIQKYDALEKKEIQVIKKMCETCRYDDSKLMFAGQPCKSCNHNNKWEAKDNG